MEVGMDVKATAAATPTAGGLYTSYNGSLTSQQELTDDDGDDVENSSSSKGKLLVASEAAQLEALERRLSVRHLALQFETGQHAPAKDTVKEEVVVTDRTTLTKKLQALLSELAGRLVGKQKDDAAEILSMLEMMEVQWGLKESELAQERADVKKMAALFKQASDDARRMVDEARSNAQAEVDAARAEVKAARATVARVEAAMEAAIEDRKESLSIDEKKELEQMRKEITEARRIRMLHEPSKTMDMEFEIEGLREQLTKKAVEVISLRKELVDAKRVAGAGPYELQGEERLGTSLIISPIDKNGPDLSKCNIQWHRVSVDGAKGGPVTGATRPQFSPEPFDVGWLLHANIILPNGKTEVASTSGPLDAAPGLGNYVEGLFKKGGADFNVRLVQQNGEILEKPSRHVLLVDSTRIKLSKNRSTKVKEEYSSIVQLCGARGGGQAAARALYWVPNKGLSLMLVLESERERNAAIMLARRFACDQNVTLVGPDDELSMGKNTASAA
ncbi:unnamed protein product [Sphagnum troendelagicum]|uniref:Stomatal closure-related actin-binding protein 1 n=1 Tax=Sphagnum troendelagicum TaxID=128251 RepID=A0ABP0TZY2_9BRYO